MSEPLAKGSCEVKSSTRHANRLAMYWKCDGIAPICRPFWEEDWMESTYPGMCVPPPDDGRRVFIQLFTKEEAKPKGRNLSDIGGLAAGQGGRPPGSPGAPRDLQDR